ncbi:MAG: phytanoyl-CoA dioxygenase family protein [Bacteroidia bacterium]|nr:phytanoyl-CoA dioxygenase family protein [Bacteroidia bacterium]
MKTIFRDPALQAAFAKDGLVTVPLLSRGEAEDLLAFYQSLPMQSREGFHASMFQPDAALRRAADDQIRAVAAAKTLALLQGYRDLYANFMVKEPGTASAMKVHQDWTYVDESRFTSLAVWFPLLDTSATNGGLVFAPGTQRIFNPVRGPGVKCPYEQVDDLLRTEFAREISLKAGEAVIWEHRVVHWSPPNQSDRARVAATIILVPEAAEVFHYWRNDHLPFDQVEQFAVSHDFFMEYDILAGPKGQRSLGVKNYHFDWLTEGQLRSGLEVNLPPVEDSAKAVAAEVDSSRLGGFFAKVRRLFS